MKPSGSSLISQAFLNVPVKLHTVSKSSRGIKFNLVNPKTKNKVKQSYVDSVTKEPLERNNLLRGYEISPNSFILFDKEEIKKINESINGIISIKEYVNFKEINPLYLEKIYFLSTDKFNAKAYTLINKALSDLNVAAICIFLL